MLCDGQPDLLTDGRRRLRLCLAAGKVPSPTAYYCWTQHLMWYGDHLGSAYCHIFWNGILSRKQLFTEEKTVGIEVYILHSI